MLQRLSDIIPLRAPRHDVCSRVPHLPCQVVNFEQCGKLDLSQQKTDTLDTDVL